MQFENRELAKKELEKFLSLAEEYGYGHREDTEYGRFFIGTEIGVWKVVYNGWEGNENEKYILKHHNFLKGREKVNDGRTNFSKLYHRQKDVFGFPTLKSAFKYVDRHDRFRATELRLDGDIPKLRKELAHSTKRQKKYVNGAICRAKRKAVRNVYLLLNEIKQTEPLEYDNDCEEMEK